MTHYYSNANVRRHCRCLAIATLFQNCLAFQAFPNDPCDDRAGRGTKEYDYDDVYDRQ
jgi:hypothetical protein